MALDPVLGRIDAAISRGDSLDDIDVHVIEPTAPAANQQAALWLYAFSRISRRDQKRFVRQQFALTGL